MRAHFIVVAILVVAGSSLQAQQNVSPPLSVSDIEHGLKAGVTNTRMAELVKQYGVDFGLTDAIEKELRAAGANDELLLRVARVPHSDSPTRSTADLPTAVQPRTTPTSTEIIRIAQQVEPSVVAVYADSAIPNPDQRYPASGVIVDAEGYIVTNRHLVEHTKNLRVKLESDKPGIVHEAKVIGSDEGLDLAIIKIDVARALPSVTLGDSEKIRIGDSLIAVGLRPTAAITVGTVSAKGHHVVPSRPYHSYIRINTKLNFHNSGGPLVDMAGHVIAISNALATDFDSQPPVSFALATKSFRLAVSELIGPEHRFIRPHTGMGISMGDPKNPVEGLVIGDIEAGGPADQAGLKVGNILLTINGNKVRTLDEYIDAMVDQKPGARLSVSFRRDSSSSEESETRVTLADTAESLFARGQPPIYPTSASWATTPFSDPHSGLRINRADGFWAAMGLQAGEILLKVNDNLITTEAQFRSLVNGYRKGNGIVLFLWSATSPKGKIFNPDPLDVDPQTIPPGTFYRVGSFDVDPQTALTEIQFGAAVDSSSETVPNQRQAYQGGETPDLTAANATARAANAQKASATTSKVTVGSGGADAHDCIRQGMTPAPPGGKWPVVALQNTCSKAISVSFCWLVDDLPNNGWACWGARIDGEKSTTYNEMDEAKMSCIEGHYPGTVIPDPSCSHFQIVWNATYQDSGQQPPRPNVPRNPNQAAR